MCLLAVVMSVAALASAGAANIAGEREVKAALAALDSHLATVASEKQLAGMSVGVVHDQELIWSRGYGFASVERQIPATSATLYDIGSVTKLLTATMLMQLRDAAKLGLDDPIEQYVPEF